MELKIKKAVRGQKKARILIAGPAGAGKTMTSLLVARGLAGKDKILVIDTEHGSASLYADYCDFDVLELPDHEVGTYVSALRSAAAAKYGTVVVDSASHLWQQILDKSKKMSGNSFANWGKLGTEYEEFVKAALSYPGHMVITTRAKIKYEQEGGKVKPIGLDPIMRDGFEYEVDIYGMIDVDHNMAIRKTRIKDLADKIITKPGEELGKYIGDWLSSGAVAAEVKPGPQAPLKGTTAHVVTYTETGNAETPPPPADVCGHVLESICKFHKKTIEQAYDLDPDWVFAAVDNPKRLAKCLPIDQAALIEFVRLVRTDIRQTVTDSLNTTLETEEKV
jgi:AAA domain